MRIEILDASGNVERVILSDEEFAEAQYPGRWRVAAEQPEPVPQPRIITTRSFLRRMTAAERQTILAAMDGNIALRDSMTLLQGGLTVDLDDPLTIESVQALKAAELLDEGRADEILTAPVEDRERP